MKLAVIIINFRHYQLTHSVLADLNSQTDKDFHIIVVDNTDQNIQKLTPQKNFIQINIPNKGYANAVNVGVIQAQEAGLTHIVEINNDVRLDSDFVANWKKAFQKYPTAIIGGKIYYEKGFEYHTYYQKNAIGNVLWYAGGGFDKCNGLSYHRGVDEVDFGQYKSGITSFISGCMMGFAISTFHRIGKWNESYFMYYEDADFCERAKKLNISPIFDQDLIIYHKSGRSTGGSGSKFQTKWQNRNLIRFNWKFGKMRTFWHLLFFQLKQIF